MEKKKKQTRQDRLQDRLHNTVAELKLQKLPPSHAWNFTSVWRKRLALTRERIKIMRELEKMQSHEN